MTGSFDRTIAVPIQIDPDAIRAEMRDGGSHNITASDFGFAAGMDYHYSPGRIRRDANRGSCKWNGKAVHSSAR